MGFRIQTRRRKFCAGEQLLRRRALMSLMESRHIWLVGVGGIPVTRVSDVLWTCGGWLI